MPTVKQAQRDRTNEAPPAVTRRMTDAAIELNEIDKASREIAELAEKGRRNRLNYNDVRELLASIQILATQQRVHTQLSLRKLRHAGAKIEPEY